MAKKTDPSITFLNQWGYNVVKLPRAGIEPMDVIGKDKSMQLLGPLASVWTSTAGLPPVSDPKPMALVNGRKTDALDVSFGLSILADALRALGASAPSLDVAFQRARSVQFQYTNATTSSVFLFDARDYVASGSPRDASLLGGADAQVFLITEVLKSNSIAVTAANEHGESVALDIPAIEGMVGTSIKVAPSHTSDSSVTFTGPEPITFGFKVQQIALGENGRWSLLDIAASGGLAFEVPGATSAPKGILLPADGCRVDL